MGAPVVSTAARRILLLSGLMILALAGCGSEKQSAPQAPPVTVGKPTISEVRDYSIFTGFSRAVESADVVARVAGLLESVEFEPSTPVQAGDLLFKIEETKYRALRDGAQASLEAAEADLLRAEAELKRVEKASRSRAVSEMDVDRARADRDMSIAAVASAQADLDEADLNLSYSKVVSPIDGVVSRNLVDAGNLVGHDGPTKLTRVNKLRPIYVYFNVPESIVLKFLADNPKRPSEEIDASNQLEVGVSLTNEKGYPHKGHIDYIDNEVNTKTGTIEVRVRLENETFGIFPGLFVRVKVVGDPIPSAVQVPMTAVGTDLGGKFVLTVGENNIVEQKYVVLGATQEDNLVHVSEGLDGTETIIVNGLLFARPGLPVTPLTPEQFQAMQAEAARK